MPSMKGYKFSDRKAIAKEIDSQDKPGKPGKADDGFDAILKSLAKAGSGSGSDLRKKRRLTGRNLSNGGGPISA